MRLLSVTRVHTQKIFSALSLSLCLLHTPTPICFPFSLIKLVSDWETIGPRSSLPAENTKIDMQRRTHDTLVYYIF